MDAEQIRDQFQNEFLPYRNENWSEWHKQYLTFVKEVEEASHEEFFSPNFQKRLWDDNPITTIGPGNAITVEGAYTDSEIIEYLWKIKTHPLFTSTGLDEHFEQVLGLVRDRHSLSGKRPTSTSLEGICGYSPKRCPLHR